MCYGVKKLQSNITLPETILKDVLSDLNKADLYDVIQTRTLLMIEDQSDEGFRINFNPDTPANENTDEDIDAFLRDVVRELVEERGIDLMDFVADAVHHRKMDIFSDEIEHYQHRADKINRIIALYGRENAGHLMSYLRSPDWINGKVLEERLNELGLETEDIHTVRTMLSSVPAGLQELMEAMGVDVGTSPSGKPCVCGECD